MKIDLTEKQFRRLLDLVYVGNWVMNSTRGDDRIREYDDVESAVFAHCLSHGMVPLVEAYQGELIPSRAFAEGGMKIKQTSEFARLELAKSGGGNGMLLDTAKQVLFVVCYHPDGKSGGQILAIDTKTKAIKILDAQKGAYDGVALAKNGDLLVSDWGENLNGKIYRISAKNGFSRDSLFGKNAKANVFTKTALNLPAMKGPADMFGTKDTLYIPKMLENEVLVVDLP